MAVVVVGLVINLASAYIKHRLDSYLLRTSSWWRNKSAARVTKKEEEIQKLLANPHEELIAYLSDIRFKLMLTQAMLGGFCFGTLAVINVLFGAQRFYELLSMRPKVSAIVVVGALIITIITFVLALFFLILTTSSLLESVQERKASKKKNDGSPPDSPSPT